MLALERPGVEEQGMALLGEGDDGLVHHPDGDADELGLGLVGDHGEPSGFE